jgi:hypothetical protein
MTCGVHVIYLKFGSFNGIDPIVPNNNADSILSLGSSIYDLWPNRPTRQGPHTNAHLEAARLPAPETCDVNKINIKHGYAYDSVRVTQLGQKTNSTKLGSIRRLDHRASTSLVRLLRDGRLDLTRLVSCHIKSH